MNIPSTSEKFTNRRINGLIDTINENYTDDANIRTEVCSFIYFKQFFLKKPQSPPRLCSICLNNKRSDMFGDIIQCDK